jgi:hypothetical protein
MKRYSVVLRDNRVKERPMIDRMSKPNYLRCLSDIIGGVHIDLLKYETRHGILNQKINEHLIAAQELLIDAALKIRAAEATTDAEARNAQR